MVRCGNLRGGRGPAQRAVVAEGVFVMIPEQEALVASAAGQERYARGVVRGIAAFLAERAREP
jgi:N-acetylmuramoyl-L-alanine amidase